MIEGIKRSTGHKSSNKTRNFNYFMGTQEIIKSIPMGKRFQETELIISQLINSPSGNMHRRSISTHSNLVLTC